MSEFAPRLAALTAEEAKQLKLEKAKNEWSDWVARTKAATQELKSGEWEGARSLDFTVRAGCHLAIWGKHGKNLTATELKQVGTGMPLARPESINFDKRQPLKVHAVDVRLMGKPVNHSAWLFIGELEEGRGCMLRVYHGTNDEIPTLDINDLHIEVGLDA